MEDLNNKKSWYYDDTIRLALIFLVVFILYAIGVALFISKGDEKTIGAFEAITGISGLILSFGTVYYVVKTYQAQKQQIGMQKIQIKIQQDEIFANKKDVEFNRTLDIVYRQLEYTNMVFEKLEERYYTKLKSVDDLEYIFNCSPHFNYIFGQMIEQIKFYIQIIDKDIFHEQDKKILHQIVSASINQNIIELYSRFNLALNFNYDFDDLKRQFSEYIVKVYTSNLTLQPKNVKEMDRQKRHEFILEQKKIQIDEDVEYFGFLLDKFTELRILLNKLKK